MDKKWYVPYDIFLWNNLILVAKRKFALFFISLDYYTHTSMEWPQKEKVMTVTMITVSRLQLFFFYSGIFILGLRTIESKV